LNRLLAALPADDYLRVALTLTVVPLTLKEVLQEPGEPIKNIYFPGGGFVSIVTVLKDGRMVEVATVGREGMVGASAVINHEPPPSAAMVQAEAATGYRMSIGAFRNEMDRRGAFAELLGRYAQALSSVIMQSTACNVLHSVEQRLCRWLLLAHDRVGRDDFPLTQDFVAMMLGVTRPAVTMVAGPLQTAKLITYHHGHVTIVDRRRLEAASCECYRTATTLLNGVVPLRKVVTRLSQERARHS